MSYSIEFQGRFNLTPHLTSDQVKYLTKFARTRRMKRNSQTAQGLKDPTREAVNLPTGTEAEYFVGGLDDYGQDICDCPSIIDINSPPSTQPNLWCQWIPLEDGSAIKWDGGEKFYDYAKWMRYIIDHFLRPWGIVVNGCIKLEGEDGNDMGKITVLNNTVTTK